MFGVRKRKYSSVNSLVVEKEVFKEFVLKLKLCKSYRTTF